MEVATRTGWFPDRAWACRRSHQPSEAASPERGRARGRAGRERATEPWALSPTHGSEPRGSGRIPPGARADPVGRVGGRS